MLRVRVLLQRRVYTRLPFRSLPEIARREFSAGVPFDSLAENTSRRGVARPCAPYLGYTECSTK